MSEPTADPDTLSMLELLRDIAGDSNDPDAALAERLVSAAGLEERDLDRVLGELLRDAR